MGGHELDEVVLAHRESTARLAPAHPHHREMREHQERQFLAEGSTLATGAGKRERPEEPDPYRTCFEKDRDRIVHSTAFRRLAGKTQVVVYPKDHQRTRLTHALEVAQVATSVARAVGANVTLAEAIALGHDCGHGPGGHASETAFDPYLPSGYDHGPWGADIALRPLNLCEETLDGIRNHSWSRPAPQTVEGEIVSWADRIAYCAHDLEDALHAGIVTVEQIPPSVTSIAGSTRSQQLHTYITAMIDTITTHQVIGMDQLTAQGLRELRAFNYDQIYTRDEAVAQSDAVVVILRALVDYLIDNPAQVPGAHKDPPSFLAAIETPVWRAIEYVSGMTDRFAFEQAETLLGYDLTRIPAGIGRGA
ncbi:MAG: HD domain-containing protein [Propionibacteriaceae bacterium]|nr:HD domain-containing protein [Propionibacteriaceae bacterium]